MGPNLEARLTMLIESTTSLSDSVERLVETVRITQRVQRRLAIGLVVLVVVVVCMILLGAQVRSNTRTMHQVQCNLYGLFVGSLENPDPGQVDTPEKRERFEKAKALILADYDALNC